jgi:hypothetical protein
MQRGQIFQRHGAWHLRYRVEDEQVSRKLADFSDLYRTEKSVRTLADQILSPVNQGLDSGGLQTLPALIETAYPRPLEGSRRELRVGLPHCWERQPAWAGEAVERTHSPANTTRVKSRQKRGAAGLCIRFIIVSF